MKRAEKEKAVGFISERLQRSKAVILADYRGLKVSEVTQLRRQIKKANGDLRVVKNRLAKRALAGTGIAALSDFFKGTTAVAFSFGDPVEFTKVLAKFVESCEKFQLRAGLLGAQVISKKEIEALSKLPQREVLYAKMLGTLQAPAANLARALQGVLQKLVGTLDAVRKTKS